MSFTLLEKRCRIASCCWLSSTYSGRLPRPQSCSRAAPGPSKLDRHAGRIPVFANPRLGRRAPRRASGPITRIPALGCDLAESLGKGKTAFGSFLLSASPVLAEVLGHAGMDFVVVDMEHSPISTSEVLPLLVAVQCTGASALVRVPSNDEVALKKVLDLGPSGVIVPLVNTAEEARAAARACMYPPAGTRGVAYPLVRASRYGMDPMYLETCESQTLVLVQVESKDAVDNLPQILDVEGIDGIFIGPLDLSASIGRIGDVDCTEVQSLLQTVEDLVPKAGKVLAGFQSGSRTASEMFSVGYSMVAGAVDIGLVRDGAKAAIARARVTAATDS